MNERNTSMSIGRYNYSFISESDFLEILIKNFEKLIKEELELKNPSEFVKEIVSSLYYNSNKMISKGILNKYSGNYNESDEKYLIELIIINLKLIHERGPILINPVKFVEKVVSLLKNTNYAFGFDSKDLIKKGILL